VNQTDHRIPVISDPEELHIPWRTLQTIIAGRSLIDTFELNVGSLDEAHKFLHAYGMESSDYAEELRKTAFEYLENVLLKNSDLHFPKNINKLKLPELLLEASADPKSRVSEWSCVILKICHAVAHAKWRKDCRIPIVEYKIKTEKKFFRIVTKLLLKEGNLSARIYDHIGVRFVTNDIFSAILLIKFLRSRNIFMYANLLPRESKNSMAELHQIEELFSEFNDPIEHNIAGETRPVNPARENPFSSQDFKMIKIVERVLVTTGNGRKTFFPCEFQILTRQTHETISKKKISHAAYEKRQIEGVKNRLFKGTSLLENR